MEFIIIFLSAFVLGWIVGVLMLLDNLHKYGISYEDGGVCLNGHPLDKIKKDIDR